MTKIKDIAITLGIIILVVLIAMFAINKIDFLKNIFGIQAQEIKVEDTPEYKAIQKDRDRIREERNILIVKDSLQGFWIDKLLSEDKRNKIIYLNENKRIEKNTANTNFTELKQIIRSRMVP